MNTNDDGCRLCFRSKWQLSVCHMRKIYLKKENSIASNILSSHTRTHMLCNPQACSIVLFINAKHVKCLPARSEEPLDRVDVAARDTSTVQMVKIKISLQTFFFLMIIFCHFHLNSTCFFPDVRSHLFSESQKLKHLQRVSAIFHQSEDC